MRISRLRLLGFKSFVDATELIIEPGLTGVVGPNGCGKSNLLEALRWAMGETSHKSMRAAAMDDVIFSGTNSRPARNTAEVTMMLDNSARLAPSEFNDTDIIEISRRIERDSGSNYKINGREARARDIKLLFEDAATGARSPALVRQGQIGDIVNAKPEARRRILEDAAGTAGLYTRRHEAELRLNAAEANLARLDDVVGGLNTQVEALKRQARQARRYKDLSSEIRKAEALFHFVCWSDAASEAEAAEARLADIMIRHGEAVRLESEALKAEAKANEDLAPLREDEAVRAALLARKRIEAEHFEREAKQALERAEELQNRFEQIETDIGREENFQTEASEILVRLRTEHADLTAKAKDDETARKALKQACDAADAKAATCEATLSQATVEVATRQTRKAEVTAAYARQQTACEALDRRVEALTLQLAKLDKKAQSRTDQTDVADRAAALEAEIVASEAATLSSEASIADASTALQDARARATNAKLKLAELATERQTLARLIGAPHDPSAPPVLDQLTVKRGFETALGAALGDDLDVPASKHAPIAWRTIHWPANNAADPALPVGATPLAAKVKAPTELTRRLAQIGIVDKADGPRLQADLRPGQRLVSKDGDLWRWDGFTVASEGQTAAARRLEQKNRLAAIQSEEAEARNLSNAAAQDEHAAAQTLASHQDALKAHTVSQRETRQALSTLRRDEEAERAKWRAHDAEKTRLDATLVGSRDEAATAHAAKADLEAALGNLDETALEEATAAQDKANDAATTARAAQAEARAALHTLQREIQSRETRLAAIARETESWTTRAEQAKAHIVDLTARRDSLATQLKAVASLPDELELRRQDLLNGLKTTEAEHRLATDSFQAAQTHLRESLKALRNAQTALTEAKEARARADAQREAAQQALENETQRIRETLSVTPLACLEIAERTDDEPLPQRADIERHFTRLKADRERLGGVNLQADDDLERIGEEVARIAAERTDVEEGIAKLRGAISQLNKEGRKRLLTAFEKVDEHFQRLFGVLFGGGEARLQLIENAEDPLQGGLEIIARPPGKKPATLSLLSGGEQTLTALSLIFAVFLSNPSPICVLDEVDAPLDDANVDRFCTMMEQMASETETRFLVITHHPMTMTRMNRLFGVTMAEKGVSQLVSVDLETAQSFQEAS